MGDADAGVTAADVDAAADPTDADRGPTEVGDVDVTGGDDEVLVGQPTGDGPTRAGGPGADPLLTWVKVAARAAASKTDAETVVLEVGAVLSITGWFVITSAGNTRLVKAVTEEIEEQVMDAGGPKPLRIEGLDDLRWVVLDYGDFVVHVFVDEARQYYELERLWRDVPVIDWADETSTTPGA